MTFYLILPIIIIYYSRLNYSKNLIKEYLQIINLRKKLFQN